MDKKINICYLYPDILSLYGDKGNILALTNRLRWRGINAEVTEICVGDKFEQKDYDIFFMGGGQFTEQKIFLDIINDDFCEQFKQLKEQNKVLLAICAGYQLLGEYYENLKGERFNGANCLPVYTKEGKGRLIGNYCFSFNTENKAMKIIGFENHQGRTYLKEGAKEMGRMIFGFGNNAKDGSEGVRDKNCFGTYAHGPILPRNYEFCDYLLDLAMKNKYDISIFDKSFKTLDDAIEKEAHAFNNFKKYEQ
ncbi:MAG TPA: glutamine amidotransferase [Lachnospiraceae bacterium]|nr:glutamine amidotransferase [Lachnospiraceae bacterium]